MASRILTFLRRRGPQALVCGGMQPRPRCLNMFCKTGLDGSLHHVVSRTRSPRAPMKSHKRTCDVQKPACELAPALCCPGTSRPRLAQRNCSWSARRGGRTGTSPNEQAAYKRVARPKHFGGGFTGDVDTRASGEGRFYIDSRTTS